MGAPATPFTWQKQGQDGDKVFQNSQGKSCVFYFEYMEYILNCRVFYFKELLLLLLRMSTAVCVRRKGAEKEKETLIAFKIVCISLDIITTVLHTGIYKL